MPILGQIRKDITKTEKQEITKMEKTLSSTSLAFDAPLFVKAVEALSRPQKIIAEMISLQKVFTIPLIDVTIPPSLPKSSQEILLEEQNDLLSALIKKHNNTGGTFSYDYNHVTNTFIILEPRLSAINFNAKSRNNSMSLLFGLFYDILEERGKTHENYKKIFVTTDEITRRLERMGKNVDKDWIKNTRSSIVNHKIPSDLSEIVRISEFDRQRKGYYFMIKITAFNPNLN